MVLIDDRGCLCLCCPVFDTSFISEQFSISLSLFHLCFAVSCLHHTLVVSSSGGAANHHASKLGRYKKMVGKLQNNQPVWMKETGYTRYLYYSNTSKYWVVDNDLNQSAISMHSPDVSISEKTIPRSGWKYGDTKKFVSDTSLTISGGY